MPLTAGIGLTSGEHFNPMTNCPKCGVANQIVNQCGCDPNNLPTKVPTSLYEEIVAAGIRFDHHASDLYIPDTERTREILGRYPGEWQNAQAFICQKSGEPWIDVPFAYTPYWDAVEARNQASQPQPKAL